MENLTENFTEKIIQLTIENKTQYIKDTLYKYFESREKENLTFSIEHIIKGDFVFFLAYLIDENSTFSHAYFMLTCNIYGSDNLYKNINVICRKGYDLTDVINNTKKYFNNYANELNNI